MSQIETRTDARTKVVHPNDLLKVGGQRVEALMQMQHELVATFEQVQRDRLARVTDEMKLTSEFAARISRAKSIPDIMTICQEWISQHMTMATEDSRKFFDDSQTIASRYLRLLSSGGGETTT